MNIDSILRFEHLASDFARLAATLEGVSAVALPHLNAGPLATSETTTSDGAAAIEAIYSTDMTEFEFARWGS